MYYINSINHIDLLIFCIIVNTVMYVFLYKQEYRQNYSSKLFRRLILSAIFVGFFETSSWLFAIPNYQAFIPIRYWSNALFLSLDTLPAAFGLCYLDYKIFASEKKNKRHILFYLTPVYLNFGFMIYNIFSDGFLFSVDIANQYHRGFATYIGNAFTYLIVLASILYFIRYKKLITGRITQSIIVLTLLPVIGVILQMLFYGLSLGIPSYTLAIFISFLLLERDELLKDPLTLLNSRTQMKHRLQFKLKSEEPFTAIIIDVNDFKQINDRYGHTVGDIVLKDVSRILLSEANPEDFVCRYGGDEFFIILESTKDIGHHYIERVNRALLEYASRNPYSIALSFGILYVDHSIKYAVEELIRITDQRMYAEKTRRRH